MRLFPAILPIGTMLVLCGCATAPPPPMPGPSAVEQHIQESVRRIKAETEELNRAQQAALPPTSLMPAPVDPKTAPQKLQSPITWHWPGPLDKAVREIAGRIGYQVVPHGLKPTDPIWVRVDADQTPAISVFESLGLQAGDRATLRMDDQTTTVHIFYGAPNTGNM